MQVRYQLRQRPEDIDPSSQGPEGRTGVYEIVKVGDAGVAVTTPWLLLHPHAPTAV